MHRDACRRRRDARKRGTDRAHDRPGGGGENRGSTVGGGGDELARTTMVASAEKKEEKGEGTQKHHSWKE